MLALIAALATALSVIIVVLVVLWALRRPVAEDAPEEEATLQPLVLRLARAFSLERRDLRGSAVSRFILYAFPAPPRLSPLPLNDVVAMCVDAILPANGRRPAARVVFDPAPDAGYCALDPDQFHQVLLNLILNARDASGASGLVSVRTQRLEDTVLVAVRDSGPGVPPSEIEGLARPFRSAKPRALGIGLATCKAIVAAHGGTIGVMNVLPKGLEVVIILRRVAAPALAASSLSSERPAASRPA
jgi:signal transduction histidine kinase